MSLYSKQGIQGGQIHSPDGKYILIVELKHDRNDPNGYMSYRIKDKYEMSARLSGWRTEVLWSPDSRAFAVNQTEGGGGIGQRAYIFYIENRGLRRVDVSPPIEKRFGNPVKCEVPVRPNTAILHWIGSDRILVVAEIVPVSICHCMGTFASYELSLPDLRVLSAYTQIETKRKFGESLGCELRAGDDKCAASWQKQGWDPAAKIN